MRSSGDQNPYRLHHELGALMTAKVGVVRDNAELDAAAGALTELEQRFSRLDLSDNNTWANQSLAHARQVFDMVKLAQVITASARARDECRGAHYKPAFELPMPADKYPGDPEFEAYREQWKAKNERLAEDHRRRSRPGRTAHRFRAGGPESAAAGTTA